MVTKKSKSINHLYDNNDLTFKELDDIMHRALLGKLGSITTGKIVEKTDGQNLIATYRNNKTVIAFGNGSEINIDLLHDRYADKPHLEKQFKTAYKILNNIFENFNGLNKYLDNGNVWLNMEVVNPDTRNVIYYGENTFLQIHNFVKFTNKVRIEFVENLNQFLNDVISDSLILSPHEVIFNDRNLENNSKVYGSFHYKLSKLLSDVNITETDKIRDYYLQSFEEIIKKQFPTLSRESVTYLKNRWGGFNRSYKLTGQSFIKEKNMIASIREFDQEAWELSKQLKHKLKEIVLFAGTYVIKNIKNPLTTDQEEAIALMIEDHRKFKKNIQNLSNKEQEYCNDLLYIINNIGLNNFVPIEGIVFTYKNNQYKITSGLFTYINQLHGLLRYKRKIK